MNRIVQRQILSAILTSDTVRQVRHTLFEIDAQDEALIVGGPTVRDTRRALTDVDKQDRVLSEKDLAYVLDTLLPF